MSGNGLSRRGFLQKGALYGGGALLALQLPRPMALRAAAASSEPAVLSPAEWKTVEAIASRILPTDEQPGAQEAGCVNFIDKALAHEDAAARPIYRAGLPGIDAVARQRHAASFASLGPGEQDAILAALETGSPEGWPAAAGPAPVFFETVRVHTVIGFLADPKYGGNRDFAGWRVTGYPGPRHRMGGYTADQVTGKTRVRTVWGEDL